MPTVSFILPFFNAENTIHRAISSIIAQTSSDWELILVDNGCTDSGYKIAQSLAQSSRQISLIIEDHPGVVHAFNTGLTHAQGTYIARMDADDISHPTRLEKQLALMEQQPEIGVVSGQVRYQSDLPQRGMKNYVDWVNALVVPEQIAINRFVELPMINPTLTFRRTCLEQLGSYRSGDFPEDYELMLRWLGQGVGMAKVPDVVLDWYDYPQRLTRTDDRYTTDAFYRIKTHYLADWLQQHNPFYPKIVVWGAGRKSRQRARLLEEKGIKIDAYIDVVRDKTQEHPCIFYQDIAPPGQYFVVSYVGNRGQREKIRDFLISRGYQEGVHFILAA
ncbi:MAG: glycosyltransferase family A protein [Cyclobacteriaceae bacterium]